VPGKTDIRWSDSEWAALEAFAAASALRPGQAAKAIVLQRLGSWVGPAREIGSAAPRERESAGARAHEDLVDESGAAPRPPASSRSAEFDGLREAVMTNGANLPVVGAAEEATAGRLEPGKRVDVATPRRTATAGAAATSVPPSPRPPESAGSTARPPAGGSAADSSAVAELAEGTRLLDAVVAALRAQGATNGVELVARRAIRAGQVVVDGDACRDPERLVDPASLGV
jgi:hypothetical protein